MCRLACINFSHFGGEGFFFLGVSVCFRLKRVCVCYSYKFAGKNSFKVAKGWSCCYVNRFKEESWLFYPWTRIPVIFIIWRMFVEKGVTNGDQLFPHDMFSRLIPECILRMSGQRISFVKKKKKILIIEKLGLKCLVGRVQGFCCSWVFNGVWCWVMFVRNVCSDGIRLISELQLASPMFI